MCWPFHRSKSQSAGLLPAQQSSTPHPPSQISDDLPKTIVPNPAQQKLRLCEFLVLGPRGCGKNTLLRLIQHGVYSPGYDPTETTNYRKRYTLPQGLPDVIVDFSSHSYSEEYQALNDLMIKNHEYFILVYRAGDREGLGVVEMLYHNYIAKREPRAEWVGVVATCIDLMRPEAVERPSEGRAFAEKFGLEFVPVSAKTGEGCGVLEAVVKGVMAGRLRR